MESSDDDDESVHSGDTLTMAQREAYERIQHAIWPLSFNYMDDDGNCYDSEGHWIDWVFPNSYYGLSDTDSDTDDDDIEENANTAGMRT